jgi:hypothetical protein
MRSLEARLSRLEKKRKAKKHRVPTLAEYLDVLSRYLARNSYTAFSKLIGEEWSWNRLKESQRKLLEGDTPELAARDKDVMQRSEGVHWRDSGNAAEKTRQRLREMKRVIVGGPE